MSVIILSLFLIGCLDYKAYDLKNSKDSSDIVNEIAALENDLNTTTATEDNLIEKEVVAEVTLPEVKEETTQEIEAPSITDQTISIKENEWVRLQIKATDPDNDRLIYTYSKPINQMGEWKTNYGDAGEYMITVKATDGKLVAQKNIKLVIERVNVPPIIQPLKEMTIKEGQTVAVSPVVTDPNKDKVTVTISDPLKSGTFKTDHTSAGDYEITVAATDGELEAKQTFKLTIQDVNMLPVISGVQDLIIKEGETITIRPQVSDVDNEPVTVTISDPVGNDGVWQTKYTEHGRYPITITANDGKTEVKKVISLVVEDVNMPPEIMDISLTTSTAAK